MWKWMLRFSALPKRCTSVTAPPCASARVCPLRAISHASIARTTIRSTDPIASGSRANRNRNGNGTLETGQRALLGLHERRELTIVARHHLVKQRLLRAVASVRSPALAAGEGSRTALPTSAPARHTPPPANPVDEQRDQHARVRWRRYPASRSRKNDAGTRRSTSTTRKRRKPTTKPNLAKRQVQSPKVYVRDSGLHQLLGLEPGRRHCMNINH
jgi:hypothetical protein